MRYSSKRSNICKKLRFLSFAKNMGKHIGKNISKNFSRRNTERKIYISRTKANY